MSAYSLTKGRFLEKARKKLCEELTTATDCYDEHLRWVLDLECMADKERKLTLAYRAVRKNGLSL
jgi:hypothetical protein